MSVRLAGYVTAKNVIIGSNVALPFTPADLFTSGQKGAWYNPTNLSTMFQTDAETTPVTAQGQTIGRINDLSPNGYYISQSSVVEQPTLDSYSNITGQSSVMINRVKTNLPSTGTFYPTQLNWSGVTGTYWIAYANITRVQIYKCILTNGAAIPAIEFSQMVIRDVAFTNEETIALTNYLEQYRAGLATPTYLFELYGTNFQLPSTTATSGIVSWKVGDSVIATDVTYTPRTSAEFTVTPESTLTYFQSTGDYITGSIPDLLLTTGLTYFGITQCRLTGGIPDLSQNVNLTEFFVSNNNLTGYIPDLSQNVNLTEFRVGDNNLTGYIPDLSPNINLEIFQCMKNNLLGSIPVSISSHPSLRVFSCFDNNITGSIPLLPASIEMFDCSMNDLTVNITDLSSNVNLIYFNCSSNNQLTGSIPDLSANVGLLEFRCHNTLLSGDIPDLSANIALYGFYCSDAQLSGDIPNLSANVNLAEFNCSFNMLDGTILTTSFPPSLTSFNCSNNQLTGDIPASLFSPSLTYLTCNNNLFDGTVGALSPAVVELQLNENQLSGSIPSFAGLVNIADVLLNSNNFSGDIPDLSDCISLLNFNCSSNASITGFAAGGGFPPNFQGLFNASSCGLTEAAVDAILAAVDPNNIGGDQIYLNGSGNAAPSAAGMANVTRLTNSGWAVYTN